VLASALLCGCTTTALNLTYPSTDAANVEVARSLPRDAIRLGWVTGLSCQTNFAGRSTRSEEDALAKAKVAAAEIGATHVTRVSYAKTGMVDGCGVLAGIKARALAFRMIDKAAYDND